MARWTLRLWRLARQGLSQAKLLRLTCLAPRAKPAGWLAGGAYPRPQIKQRLREVTRPGAGGLIGQKTLRQCIKPGLGGGQGFLHREDPRGDAFDIAIKGHNGRVESNGGDSGSGIRANAGQGGQTLPRFGKSAQSEDLSCRRMQVTRAGVIAKPGPFGGHIFPRRPSQGSQIREARQKTRKARPYRCHRCLLQHDFR